MADETIQDVADQYSMAADEHGIDIFRIYAAALRLKAIYRGESFERRALGSRRFPNAARVPSIAREMRDG